MAECLAGAGVATAALGMEAFNYNRENFMYDRDQRREKEFKTMEMQIAQAGQWREDVSDLVSLTEKKMHIYLLTTILLVLVTIFLWAEVEDTLDPATPNWLLTGYALANTGAFMFFMLSLWLAIHAAVVAQGYNARLRTQMVRLPIPSWQEMEACRTYGSQFERAEGRQMFRVPFVTGRQEDLVRTTTASEQEPGAGSVTESEARPNTDVAPDASPAVGEPSAQNTAASGANFADPWGLERSGNETKALGMPIGAKVAGLRHIRLTRQAATLWQTYDGFSRVALTVGINQLILTLSYYYLAYLVVDVGCRYEGTAAVLVLIVLADACLKLEISLQSWQLTIAMILGVLGPVFGCVAAWNTTKTDLSYVVTQWFIPFAFCCHGLYLAFLIHLFYIMKQDNGARVPAAFKQKLYLDAFGWVGHSRPSSADKPPQVTGLDKDTVKQPTTYNVTYENGKPRATLPQDLCSTGYGDMRFEGGACDPSQRLSAEDKVEVPYFKWGLDGMDHADNSNEIVTGHNAEAPGLFPWVVFRGGLVLLSIVWIGAGAWKFESACSITRTRVLSMHPTENHTHAAFVDARLPELFQLWASGYIGKSFSGQSLEAVPVVWPHRHISPRTLACDTSGQHLLATDGLLTFVAKIPQSNLAVPKHKIPATFVELHCPALVGESLQDAALACGDESCQAFVLHRHGRRVATCQVTRANKFAPGDAKVMPTAIAETWLERDNVTNVEKVSALAMRPGCEGGISHCTFVHTTHGRTLQLRLRTRGSDLIPNEILQEDNQPTMGNSRSGRVSGTMRAFNGRYFGVLRQQKQSIDVLDAVRGGFPVGKILLPPHQHVTSWCAGGGQLYMLADGQVWRTPLPHKLSTP